MVDGHNWNQIHQVLIANNYIVVQSYSQGVISYRHPKQSPLVINKSNNMSCEFLNSILGRINISYEIFVQTYEKAYSRS